MITSMTGYGRAAFRSDGTEILVEIRTVNNRFLDIMTKLPRCIAGYEQQVRELISKRLQRGRVSVYISLSRGDESGIQLDLNLEVAKAYLKIAQKLEQDLGVAGKLSVAELLAMPDVIAVPVQETTDEEIWQLAEQSLQAAIEQLVAMRAEEGKNLAQDFRHRVEQLEKLIEEMEKRAVEQPRIEMDKLRERITKLIDNRDAVDESRLEMELALIADRIDITEECVRFHSHNQLFLQTLELEPSQGRKLNFLLQEMHREANTIGSKTSQSDVSHIVVSIKDEIEKMREQVQNIE
ncbi:MAG TPA: YicC family protein [bacterium]|nr:YicC family protein [bacterium]HNT65220.1 YicC family protein [bacterium]